MPRNNKLIALNRWKNTRERERLKFAAPESVRIEKAALCGFLAGDGGICVRQYKGNVNYQVKFYPDDSYMLETFLKFFTQVYGKTPTVKDVGSYYVVQISYRSITEHILSLTKFGVHRWQIPLLETTGEKVAWLRAFFSAEGYVGVKSVRVQTTNKTGMQSVSQLLNDLDINHNCYTYQPKKPEHSTVYIIAILQLQSRRKYFKEVGFWHEKKTNALAKALDLKANYRSSIP